ncbi:MAG TPA: Flp pilus assembly protein CpaB [Desulfuromonadaceae bacterium]|jgi:pilus assembly protein CpaB
MKRPSTAIIVTVFAFLLAGCASFFSYNYLKKQGSTQSQGVAIVAAATDIPMGTKLDASHVKLATWPKEALTNGYHTDAKKLSGRVAVRPMSAGDIITEVKLMPQNGATSGGIMTYIVPQGHRAVTVAVNEVAGVAGFITPGSRVDIVLTTPRPGSDKEDNISKIILQNVPVLASGQGTEQKEGKPVIVPTVTLDLTPEDAEKLIVGVGSKKGTLQLLLRNVIDTAAVDTKGATVSKALYGAEAPTVKMAVRKSETRKVANSSPSTPPIQAKISVEVIKGGVKTTKDFPIEN